MSQQERLFSEFPPVSREQWEEVIIKELKGADYEKKLMWKSPEGIIIKPYYTKEDIQNIPYYNKEHTEAPVYRTRKKTNNWTIFEEVYVADVLKANEQAVDALQRGAEGIEFIIQEKIHYDLCNHFKTFDDLALLLKNIDITKTPIRFVAGCSSGVILSILDEYIENQQIDKKTVNVSFDYDPIGHLTVNGNFFTAEEHLFPQTKTLLEYADRITSNQSKVIGIQGYLFQNAGATILQELALSLSITAEYLTNLSELGLSVETIAKRINLNFGVASNYFMEIAKFRAARYLWSKLLEAYDVKINDFPFNIHAVTTTWNKTAYDPYVNLLRLTTEAMSAVLGGTDSLTVKPFDSVYKSPDAFSRRLSRNIQLILKEEVHLDKVIDPAGGSYYVESLTHSLINEAWNLFLQIQDIGGYIAAFKEGKIQAMIEETQQKRDMNIAMRQEILLGTNQYPNLKETISEQIVPCIIGGFMPSGKPVYKNIKLYRGAHAFEELRLETEKLPKRPKVFLLTFGNLAMRKARANFSINFFGCAGYEVIDNPGFASVEEGIKAANDSDAEFVVICSSDDEYPQIVPDIMNGIHSSKIVVLAGYPKEHIETFMQFGLSQFIHIKSNVLETLQKFNSMIKERFVVN